MDSFEALISSDVPGPLIKDEVFDLDDFLDFDEFLARQRPSATGRESEPELPCGGHSTTRNGVTGLYSSSSPQRCAPAPLATLPPGTSSSSSTGQDRFEVPKRERSATTDTDCSPLGGMSNAEYLSRMKFRPIASAADRPPVAPKARERGKREKTGCFTCRKRRIKCDERLPTCRNCEKARKKCSGYDPKNLPDPSWDSLPQPISRILPSCGTSDPSPHPSSPQLPLKRNRDDRDCCGDSTSNKRARPSLTNPPHSSDIISPGERIRSPMASAPAAPQPGGAPYNAVFANSLNAQASNISQERAYGGTTTAYQPSLWSEAHSRIEKQRELRIEDLYLMGGADPPTPRVEQPIPEDILEEIKDLYVHEYARGIDAFLETSWYSQHGQKHLLLDGRLLEMFAGMVEIFRTTASSDFEVQHRLPSTEARIVWLLLCLARKAATSSSEDVQVTPAERQELTHIIARLAVLEHLLTGRTLLTNPVLAHSQTTQYTSVQQSRQHRFWALLGHLVTLRCDDTGRAAADAALQSIRQLLDGMESRDVLYSIAMVRHLGSQTPDFPDKLVPGTASAGLGSEDKKKLLVAKKFLEDEAAEGTYQVVQRICGMARRGWTHLRSA